jgi:hypothetical protein
MNQLPVLSADYFSESTVPDERIKDLYSVLTIVNGKVVYNDLHGRKAANGRIDSVHSRSHQSARPAKAGTAGLRVLRSSQTGNGSPAARKGRSLMIDPERPGVFGRGFAHSAAAAPAGAGPRHAYH